MRLRIVLVFVVCVVMMLLVIKFSSVLVVDRVPPSPSQRAYPFINRNARYPFMVDLTVLPFKMFLNLSSQCPHTHIAIDWRQARRHWKGKHILFIGDSLTRYQYLNLAYFMTTGHWRSPCPWNEKERDHGTWDQFFRTTTERMGGFETCDCWRVGDNYSNYREIRRYRNPHADIAITFVQSFISRCICRAQHGAAP